MSDARTSLEIAIRTTADLQGVKLSEDALQKVVRKAEELDQKNRQNAQSTSGVTDAMKERAQQALRNIEADEKAAQAAQRAGRAVNELGKGLGATSRLGQGMAQVMSGLAQRDLPGLLTAGRGVVSVFRTIGEVLTVFGRGAAASAVLAGPLLVLIGAMKAAANDAEAAMKRWWDEAAAGAERYKQESAAVKEAAAKDLAGMLADVSKLSAAWATVISQMATAEQRSKEITAAQKELALAKASTPEEKAAIEAQFGAAGIASDVANAKLSEKNAWEAQTQALQEVRNAEAGVRDAEARLKSNPSRANQEAVALAKENLEQVQSKAGDVFKSTNEVIDRAQHTQRVSGLKKQTLEVTSAKSAAGAFDPARAAELRRTAEQAQQRGDFSAQDAAVKELRSMTAAANKLAKAVVDAGATTTKALGAATQELEKQKKQTQRAQQAGAGGGG